MFNDLIKFLTNNQTGESNQKIEPVKEKTLAERYQDQLALALCDAKCEMQEFMDTLPDDKFSSGYLQQDYNGIQPNLESIVVPARLCAQDTVRSLTRTGDIYDTEKETLIFEAKKIFKNLSESVLNSMFGDIELALKDLMSKYNVDTDRFKFDRMYSFYWVTDLVAYKPPQYGSSNSFRITPNTLETVIVSVYTSIQTEFSNFLIYKHVDNHSKIMDEFFNNYANHIRAYIYDTVVELVRISKIIIGGLHREGIDYYKYEDRQFMPACFSED